MPFFVTKNGDKYGVSLEAAKISKLAANQLEDDDSMADVYVPNVDFETVREIAEFLEMFAKDPFPTIPVPLPHSDFDLLLPEPYVALMKAMPNKKVFRMLQAADFMVIDPLIELTASYIASQCKGKTPDQIRILFNLENELTDEEKALVEEENAWQNDEELGGP